MDNTFSQEQLNKIIDMYINKCSIDEIINYFNTDEHSIRTVLKENQIDRHYNSWSDELYDRGIELYNSGKTLKYISYHLLVSKNGFSKALEKKKVEKRTYSENNRKYKRNSEYFDNINTPNKAYILGFIYADGNNYIWGNKHCLTISIQENDRELLERIRIELEYEGELRTIPLNEKNPNYKNQCDLVITDEYMCNQLKRLGVVQRKSLVITFPTFLRPDLIRHFVRGYFDGDGCIYYDEKRNKCRTSTCGTFNFCDSLSKILESFFIKHNIYQPIQCQCKNTCVLQTAANLSSYKFLSWLYQDCDLKMDRKYQQYLHFCEIYTDPKGRVKSL